jgi:CheY-like chemotaxis protein
LGGMERGDMAGLPGIYSGFPAFPSCLFSRNMLFLARAYMENESMTQPERTVVVVEDEIDAAEMFAEMMRVTGFRVVKSYSSGPAISIISSEMPDVVILDIMMPDISGLEVLRYIRREPKLANIPVIVVSAKSMPSDIKTGLDAGASVYLTKPVGFLDLKEAVDKVLVRQK